jgi:adenylosuccinate lyase
MDRLDELAARRLELEKIIADATAELEVVVPALHEEIRAHLPYVEKGDIARMSERTKYSTKHIARIRRGLTSGRQRVRPE